MNDDRENDKNGDEKDITTQENEEDLTERKNESLSVLGIRESNPKYFERG